MRPDRRRHERNHRLHQSNARETRVPHLVRVRLRIPHPIILLLGCLLAAALLSYVLPAGRYERRDDPTTGRSVVVPGTFHHVPPQPLGPFQTLVALPKGLVDAASVVFLVFLVG